MYSQGETPVTLAQYLDSWPDANAELFVYDELDGDILPVNADDLEPGHRFILDGSEQYHGSVAELRGENDVQNVEDVERYLEEAGIVPLTHVYGNGPGNSVYAAAAVSAVKAGQDYGLWASGSYLHDQLQQSNRQYADLLHVGADEEAEQLRKYARNIKLKTLAALTAETAVLTGITAANPEAGIGAAVIALPTTFLMARYFAEDLSAGLVDPDHLPDMDDAY